MSEIIVFFGVLSAYAFGPTVGTVALRQEWQQLPQDLSGYEVLLSVDDCDLVGNTAVMYVGDVEYSAIVFDCAGHDAAAYMVDGNGDEEWLIAAEVDYHFWMERPELVGSGVKARIEVERWTGI